MKTPGKLLVLLLLCYSFCQGQQQTVLGPGEFEKELTQKDSIQLLDVRTIEEYKSGHLKHALLADWKDEPEFMRRISFIDKSKPVYVYCLGGGRSTSAAAKMRKMGYEQVYELKGGINAWKAENKQVEGKSDQPQMTVNELNTAIGKQGLVLVDFGAPWCPPCKKMEPVLNNLQQKFAGKFKLVAVDGGRDETIVQAYGVTELPVFILFKDGKQVWRKTGIVDEDELESLLK